MLIWKWTIKTFNYTHKFMLPYPSNRVIPADIPTIMAGITETHNTE